GGAEGTTDSNGHAALTFGTAGIHKVDVSAAASVRTETAICVHNGNDGSCGTTAPGSPPASSAAGGRTEPPYTGPFALAASVTGAAEGRVYARGSAPRLLSGTIRAHSTVSSV